MKSLFAGLLVAAFLLLPWQPAHAEKIGQTPFPSTIRVAIRENNASGEPDSRGRIVYVLTLNFEEYMRGVLPNEWLASWKPESLKAGAIAVKMFGWYHHLHPVTIDNFTFDVDDTVNFQAFRRYTDQLATNRAIIATRSLAYVPPNGDIVELNYRAGYANSPNWQYRNAQKMAQWGSQYWAEKGRTYLQILEFYYQNRTVRTIPGV